MQYLMGYIIVSMVLAAWLYLAIWRYRERRSTQQHKLVISEAMALQLAALRVAVLYGENSAANWLYRRILDIHTRRTLDTYGPAYYRINPNMEYSR